MAEKLKLDLQIIGNKVSFFEEIPEELKSHFDSFETVIRTMKGLTESFQFNELDFNYIIEEDYYATPTKMHFTFSGNKLEINILCNYDKSTVSIKESFSEIRTSFLKSFIDMGKIKYIYRTKADLDKIIVFKLYTEDGRCRTVNMYKKTVDKSALLDLFYEEKKRLNNISRFKNVKTYSNELEISIKEVKDRYPTFINIFAKPFLNEPITIEPNIDGPLTNPEVPDFDEIKDIDLSELDDIMLKTGIISIEEIREAYNKQVEGEKND